VKSKVCPGEYRARLTLQVVAKTANGKGGQTESVTSSVTVRGKVMPRRATEGQVQSVVEASRSLTVETHYRAGLSATNRLVYGDRTFRVLGVRIPDENPMLGVAYLDCEEIAP
jgi:SPP1 family predicted phage head-tail adaptor